MSINNLRLSALKAYIDITSIIDLITSTHLKIKSHFRIFSRCTNVHQQLTRGSALETVTYNDITLIKDLIRIR